MTGLNHTGFAPSSGECVSLRDGEDGGFAMSGSLPTPGSLLAPIALNWGGHV